MKYFVLIALLVSCLGCSEEDVVEDVADPHLLKTIDIPKGSVKRLRICVRSDGGVFASGIGVHGYEMNIWNCEGFLQRTFVKREDNLLTFINPPELPLDGIVFSPDWKYFATFQHHTRRNQGLNIWDLSQGGRRRILSDLPDHGVDIVTFDTKGERWAYVDRNGPVSKQGRRTIQVTIRSGISFRESATLENAGERYISHIAFSGDRIVACGSTGLIMWNLNTGKIIFTDNEIHTDSVRAGDTLMFSLDGKQFIIATGYEDEIQIRNSDDGSLVKNMPGYEVRAISKNWKWFATFDGMHENIQIHDMENGDIEFTLRGHTDLINDVDFSADGSRLVSVASDRTFKIWDLTK
jgi:WD40 repeat protein